MLFVVQDGLSRPRLCRPARPRVLYTRPPRSIPHNEPIALRQLQRRHPHQPPRYQSGALLLHELCPRVRSRGCIADCLTQKTSAYLARHFYEELTPNCHQNGDHSWLGNVRSFYPTHGGRRPRGMSGRRRSLYFIPGTGRPLSSSPGRRRPLRSISGSVGTPRRPDSMNGGISSEFCSGIGTVNNRANDQRIWYCFSL